jgi:hypothetical protein
MSDRYRDRPFPPDNQGRSSYGSPQDDSDPLAELARLIGQADPFSNFGRDYQPNQRTRAEPAVEEPRYEDDHPHQEQYPPRYEEELPPGPPSWMRNAAPAQPARDDYGYEQPQDEYARGVSRHSGYSLGYAQPASHQQPQYDETSEYDHAYQQDGHQPYPAASRYDEVLYGEHPNPEADEYGYDQDYQNQDYDRQYAEEPPAKRKGGLTTVFVVLALAIVGTAGAYAYRSFVGSPRSSGEPPIIKADAGPNKIVPNNQSGKQIYDRVGDKSGEQMVSREEQPVDVDARSGGPRVVFPPLTQNNSPPSTSSVVPDTRPTGPGVANGTLNGDAPRAIKTLTIRPDQPDAIAQAAASGAAPAQAAPPPRPQTAARPAVATSGPMAITPQAAPAAPEPRNRVASLNPTASPAAAGSYVQVSSQKTEADALSSYRVLQGKYAGILGSRQATVRRADLGDKGVFYRAMVGPFASTDEATQFCLNLQSAGGKCIVQRN